MGALTPPSPTCMPVAPVQQWGRAFICCGWNSRTAGHPGRWRWPWAWCAGHPLPGRRRTRRRVCRRRPSSSTFLPGHARRADHRGPKPSKACGGRSHPPAQRLRGRQYANWSPSSTSPPPTTPVAGQLVDEAPRVLRVGGGTVEPLRPGSAGRRQRRRTGEAGQHRGMPISTATALGRH